MDTLLGTTLGGYTLRRLLGSGGMGAVYLAEDSSIGQQVAIKVVRTDDSDYNSALSMEQAAERFRQEARAIASLDHLNILPLYRYGEEETSSGRRAFMIMQYRPEGSLQDWLRRRAGQSNSLSQGPVVGAPDGLPTGWPLDSEEAGLYLHQAASALQYAHDCGIIHRDIKPANFLLRFDLHATSNKVFLLLSDFGLAKFYAATSATSTILGTPIYMAPEQFNGAAGPESDQYALAVMVYYLLAGRPPFEGDPLYLMHQHLSAPPPSIRTFAPGLPIGIEKVLNRGLAKQPDQRYPSIMAFAEAFSQAQHNTSPIRMKPFTLPALPSVSPVSAMPRNKADSLPASTARPPVIQERQGVIQTPAVHASTPYSDATIKQGQQDVVSQALTEVQQPVQTQDKTALRMAQAQQASGQQANQQTAPARQSRRSALGWIVGGAVLLAAGSGAGIYIATQSGAHGLASGANIANIQPITTDTNVQYILRGHSEVVTSVTWSPDGNHLASGSADETVRIWDTGQRQARVFRGHSQAVSGVAWSSDSLLLASGSRDETVRVWNSLSTSGTSVYPPFPLRAIVNSVGWYQNSRIYAATVGNGIREIVVPQANAIPSEARISIRSIAPSPDGRFLAAGNDTGLVSVYELPTMRRISSHRLHKRAVLALAWSSNSMILASGSADRQVQVSEASTSRVLHTLPHNGIVQGIGWNPHSAAQLATIASDGNLYLWTTGNSRPALYRSRAGAMTSLSWGAMGLATGTSRGPIVVWNF